MERSRYSIKPNAGKGLSGFITNFSVAGEFDPAWLDTNCFDECKGKVKLRVFAGMILGRFVFSSVQVQADAQDATFRRV